jgi:hypothetical protein
LPMLLYKQRKCTLPYTTFWKTCPIALGKNLWKES